MMGFATMLIVFAVVFMLVNRRHRGWDRRNWGAGELPGPHGAWQQGHPGVAAPPEMDAYVESLETRIARLEERLDFTERLLQGREERGAIRSSSPPAEPGAGP